MMTSDYDLGYFEGVRNVFMAYIKSADGRTESLVWFDKWIESELKSAKELRDRWD